MPYKTDSGLHQSKTQGLDILLLHRGQGAWGRIEQTIAQRNWSYLSLSTLPALPDTRIQDSKVILIDTSFLPEINRQQRLFDAQIQSYSTLVFVSEHCDIETRVKAIRAGAKKLFLEPIDFNGLIRSIEDYIQPKAMPNYRVLVIADDETKAKPIVDLLQMDTLDTLVLTEPLAVIDSIWRFLPNLILMIELRNNDVDNIVLTKLIRGREESVAIPIVCLSEGSNSENQQQALLAGADDVLSISTHQQQLLTAIRCRIERTKVISSTGVQKHDEESVDLPDRKGILSRIERIWSDHEDGIWFYGVVVLDFESRQGDSLNENTNDMDRLITAMAKGVEPIVQEKDYLARIDHRRLALLIRRSSRKELELLKDLILEITNYRLTTHPVPVTGMGIGLAMLEEDANGDELLRRGELLAASAYRKKGEQGEYDSYPAAPSPPLIEVKEETVWLKEEFVQALQAGSVTLRERKYICLNRQKQVDETIELIPYFDFPGHPVDLYQQASLCGAAADFDQFVCQLGIDRLFEYVRRGKPVRLILRQSAAVCEDQAYVEAIKAKLRKLQIVGNGLVLEFALPAIASHLRRSTDLFNELSALGIGISLSQFPKNRSAYKALAYLKAGMVRPRSSLLYGKAESVELITRKIHSQHAEILLPEIESIENISHKWWACADYIQADLPHDKACRSEIREDLVSLYLGAYRGVPRFPRITGEPQNNPDANALA